MFLQKKKSTDENFFEINFLTNNFLFHLFCSLWFNQKHTYIQPTNFIEKMDFNRKKNVNLKFAKKIHLINHNQFM